jgi:crotonobetainyl-CoA:carnitine CoA-transferase CaiB-like acyl-CoA transferase
VKPEPLLAGLRIVEIGQYIAAPFAATLFADQGAEVIKIERPGGDPYRSDPARFAAWNRGKRSVELDLRSADGRAEARALIATADAVIENLRPGSMERLGLGLDELRARDHGLVTCSISAYGSEGPARDDPGWEPLVHARAGAQQGMFTAAHPIWLPFPMASIGAALLAVVGTGAALVKREHTGYGQHVETSLFDALLFLNAAAIFHRENRRMGIGKPANTPVLHTYETRDGRSMQLNLSGTERWREVCRLVGLDPDGECGLDFSSPESLGRLSDREWIHRVLDELTRRFGERTADEWEQALLAAPAAVAKCNTLEEWLAHDQAVANDVFVPVEDPELGSLRLAGPPVRVRADAGPAGRSRRHGSEGGALGGHRVIDMSSFWAGPLAARLLGELGADVVKVEPPGGEGAYQLMPVLPNIYVDGNRSKRGITLDLRRDEDRHRLLDLVGAADVVVENAVVGTWERLGLGEADMRAVNPTLIYARAKGFGLCGPLASRPAFDYVVQAATGMVMTQGGGRPQAMNFTANDYCTGIHLAAGTVLALLARTRGAAVTSVEGSLMLTATVFQSEQIAEIAVNGARTDAVGEDLRGPAPGCRLYEASDGWIVVYAATPEHEAALCVTFDLPGISAPAVQAAIGGLTASAALERLTAHGVPAAVSVHPSAVPDDPQVIERHLLAAIGHPVAGRFVQVGIPLRLSVDAPVVKGSAPAPARWRRQPAKARA